MNQPAGLNCLQINGIFNVFIYFLNLSGLSCLVKSVVFTNITSMASLTMGVKRSC